MRVIIIGAGKVGFSIAQTLANEKHDVVVIEQDEERFQIIQDHLDVQVVLGNGASYTVLEEAGVAETDMLIAVTEVDELNMVACLRAKQYGVKQTIARVRNPEYVEKGKTPHDVGMGIDLIINPELVTAMEIAKLIEVPEAINVEYYFDRQVQFLELRLPGNSPVINSKLKDLNFPHHCLIVAVCRNGEIIIPHGDDVLLANDVIFILARTKEMLEIEKYLGLTRTKIENVIILGGGRIGFYLAKKLEEKKIKVKIFEKDPIKCKDLAKRLNQTLVLNADATDVDFLKEEGVSKCDLFVAVTGDDKLNMLVSLLAKHLGVKKTVAQMRRSDYISLIEQVGVDIAISPRSLMAGAILRFIRKGRVLSFTFLQGDKAEVIELIVPHKWRYNGKQLKEIRFPKGAIIGAVIRDSNIIIPSGKDRIFSNDQIIVFSLLKASSKVQDLFDLN